ncbi:unnamed protein product [Cuscuta epithymum]|uniref:Uncharacterized protein n=1 Tax=Cuscuta epithymum TaxID=186058 RepID=A0AAV0F369_9ASTE|nr:unnamed protein product [Cuscuta epithymum]
MSTQRLLLRKTKPFLNASSSSAAPPFSGPSHYSNEFPNIIANPVDTFLVEKIMWTLKQGIPNVQSLMNAGQQGKCSLCLDPHDELRLWDC